ncbi:MAG: hypothetical protein WBG10_04910 [Pseudolabrys sp.]
MIQRISATMALGVGLAALQLTAVSGASAKDLKVLSEKTVTGFGHVESVAYDPRGKVFYVSDFGPDLKPADKDGKGKITKISLDGKILEDGFLPAKGQVLNKPKGIWIRGDRLWVTDIDAVWVFDLKTKEGKRLELPGITFANDPTVMGGALYISDNRSDQLVRVEPADFLKSKFAPKIGVLFKDKAINPNGLFPGKGGALLMVGLKDKDNLRAIYSMAPGKDPVALTDNFGQLDGLYQMRNGDILVTDWKTGSLNRWNKKDGLQKLAGDFKGPADFCVVPNEQGFMVAVPDLVKGEIRLIQLSRF